MDAVKSTGRVEVPYDIVVQILCWVDGDYRTLYRCSLVSKAFSGASAQYLYHKVRYQVAGRLSSGLGCGDPFQRGSFASGRLRHNAPFVREVELLGYLPTDIPDAKAFAREFTATLESWSKLHRIVLNPFQYTQSTLATIVTAVVELYSRSLQHLTIKADLLKDEDIQQLIKLRGLTSLHVLSPRQEVIEMLPQWLGALPLSLHSFEVQISNRYDRDILKAIVSALGQATSVSFGSSPTSINGMRSVAEAVTLCSQMPNLTKLQFYHLTTRQPWSQATCYLSKLRSLTVTQYELYTRSNAVALITFLCRVVRHAPLESLTVRHPDWEYGVRCTPTNINDLLASLGARHASRLRVLWMPMCYVGRKALAEFCRNCTGLEELSVAVMRETLDNFASYGAQHPRLRAVAFSLTYMKFKHRVPVTQEFAQKLINEASSIRYLAVDEAQFQGRYVLSADGAVQLVVERGEPRETYINS